MTINLDLAAKMNLTQDEITAIEVLHKKLDAFLKRPTFYVEAKDVAGVIESLETSLQLCWGFPLDKDFHRYWNKVVGCKCKAWIDNAEYLGTPFRMINPTCPFHGSIDWESDND